MALLQHSHLHLDHGASDRVFYFLTRCQENIPIDSKSQLSWDEQMRVHTTSKCKKRNKTKKKKNICAFYKCKHSMGALPFECDLCELEFCVSHRMAFDHDCPHKDTTDPNKRKVRNREVKDVLNTCGRQVENCICPDLHPLMDLLSLL